jgi:hypothetical protein
MSDREVDEDYDNDNPPLPRFIPIRLQQPQSQQPQQPQPRVARFERMSSDSDSDLDSEFGFNINQLSRMNRMNRADDVAAALAQEGLRRVVERANQEPIRANALNAALRPPPSRGSRALPAPEEQWERLTTREKNIIRRFLVKIPCKVTHSSELGLMQLINRIRNRRMLTGGGKNKSHANKSGKKSIKKIGKKTYKRRH